MANRHVAPLMYEASPDPAMRPSIDLLITKLRKMKVLVDHPEAVQFVINDLMHQFYVQEQKRPARLWQIMMMAMYKFVHITGESFPNMQMLEAAGLPPEEPQPVTVVQAGLDLEATELKAGVAHVIEQHVYRYSSNECNCGRPYPTHAEWAKHVRIRIWRYLQDEFRGD